MTTPRQGGWLWGRPSGGVEKHFERFLKERLPPDGVDTWGASGLEMEEPEPKLVMPKTKTATNVPSPPLADGVPTLDAVLANIEGIYFINYATFTCAYRKPHTHGSRPIARALGPANEDLREYRGRDVDGGLASFGRSSSRRVSVHGLQTPAIRGCGQAARRW